MSEEIKEVAPDESGASEDVKPDSSEESATPSGSEEGTEAIDADNPGDSGDAHEEDTSEENEDGEGASSEEDSSFTPTPTRAQRRIQQLVAERKALEAKLQGNGGGTAPSNPFQPNEEGEIEVNPEDLSQYISSQVQATLVQERQSALEQERSHAWDEDISELLEKTPELNPESESFDKELSDSLLQLVTRANDDGTGNLTVRVLPSEIWNSMNSVISRTSSKAKVETRKKLKDVDATSAVTGSTEATDGNPNTLSEDEINKLAATNPRKYAELIEEGVI